jgi:hypothetical protein
VAGEFVAGIRLSRLGLARADSVDAMNENSNLINKLANLFRGFSLVFGISAPPPEQDQRQFVMLWLGIIAVTVLFFVGVLFAISHLHVG